MNDAGRIYFRLRSLMCREWSTPPWELDERLTNDDVALEDVIEMYTYARTDPFAGENVRNVIFREREMNKRKRWQALQNLRAMAEVAKRSGDLQELDRLKKLMRPLQEEVARES